MLCFFEPWGSLKQVVFGKCTARIVVFVFFGRVLSSFYRSEREYCAPGGTCFVSLNMGEASNRLISESVPPVLWFLCFLGEFCRLFTARSASIALRAVLDLFLRTLGKLQPGCFRKVYRSACSFYALGGTCFLVLNFGEASNRLFFKSVPLRGRFCSAERYRIHMNSLAPHRLYRLEDEFLGMSGTTSVFNLFFEMKTAC